MTVRVVTTHCLVGLEDSGGVHIWYCRVGQRSMGGEVTGSRGDLLLLFCCVDTLANCFLNIYVYNID